MKLRQIHYLSGLTLSLFIGFHLLNHLSSLWGTEAHIHWMNQLRMIYRQPLIEFLLLLAVIGQIYSGIRLLRTRVKSVATFFRQLQIWSGLYLAFFLFIHVGAVLAGRLYFNLDTNFYFGVAGLNHFPTNLFFIPYYSIAILSFFGHIAAIHFQKMKQELFGISIKQQSRLIIVIGLICTFLIMYGLTNRFEGVLIPDTYKVLLLS